MKPVYLFILTFLIGCSSPETYLESIEQKEFSTKMSFGELVKDSLVYQYKEVFTPQNHLKTCITTFAFDFETKKNTTLNDTIEYTSEARKSFVDYFIDGVLSEKEVRKGEYLYVYDASDPTQPMLVRQFDKKGNMILEANIDAESIILREFEIKERDKNGYATLCHSHWKEVLLDENTDLNTFSIKGLRTLDSSLYITEFNYRLSK